MNQETLRFMVEKSHELMFAATCSSETKAAAQAWLDAVGTEREAVETEAYLNELKADIMPIDQLIGFAESDVGAKVFGDAAGQVAAHAKQIKAAGAKFCDCPACAVVAQILDRQ